MPTLDELKAARALTIEAADAELENARPAWEAAQVTRHDALVTAGATRDAGCRPFWDGYNADKTAAQVVLDAEEVTYLAAINKRDDDVAAAEQTYRDAVIAEEARRASP